MIPSRSPIDVATESLLTRIHKELERWDRADSTTRFGGIGKASLEVERLLLVIVEHLAARENTDRKVFFERRSRVALGSASGGHYLQVIREAVDSPGGADREVKWLIAEIRSPRSLLATAVALRNREFHVLDERGRPLTPEQRETLLRTTLHKLRDLLVHHRRALGWPVNLG